MADIEKDLLAQAGQEHYVGLRKNYVFHRSSLAIKIVLLWLLLLTAAQTALFLLRFRNVHQKQVDERNDTVTPKLPQMTPETPLKLPKSFKLASPRRLKPEKAADSIVICGDGSPVVHVKADNAVGHWKVYSKHGRCSLESARYITVNSTGLYKVYAQVAVFKNHKDGLHFKIVQNRMLIGEASLDNCKQVCSGFLMKLVLLKKGDYLSVQSNQNATFLMSSERTYFGISKMP